VLCVLTHSPHISARVVRQIDASTTVMYFPANRSLLDTFLFGYRSVQKSVATAVREFSPDIVHGQGTAKYIYAATHSRQPHLVTVHGIYRNETKVGRSTLSLAGRLKSYAKIRLEEYYIGKIQNLISITDEVSSFVRAQSPHVRIFKVDNAIDENFFAITPLGQNHAPIILFVAAITYRKGLDYLLEAFSRVLLSVPSAKLRIAGIWDWDPEYVAALKSQYASLIRAGSVVFLGGISQEQLIEEMSSAFLLCLPSRAESAPMVISQAMASARPVVASNVGGIPDMIRDGATGHLCKVGDIDGLSKRLIATLTDVESAKRMGEQGRAAAADRYSAQSVASKTIDAYLEVLRNG
jgi:glycosyltransferase involved in cell wall biosynthesis